MPKPMTQQACTDLNLPLPIDERDEQRERQQEHEHRQQMAKPSAGQSAATRARGLLSISPAETASGHPIPGLTPMIEAARDHRQP